MNLLSVESRMALFDLLAEHWARVDQIVNDEPTDLFTEDGTMVIGALKLDGHDGIAAYYLERRATEAITGRCVRHLMTNIQFVAGTADSAEVRFLITVFAGRGEIPYASASPSTIADFTASCCLDESGAWRLATLRGKPVFVGADAPANVRG